MRGIGAIGVAGFTYDLLLYSRQLPAAIELVAHFPNQKFVIDHCAKPIIKTRQFEPWARTSVNSQSFPASVANSPPHNRSGLEFPGSPLTCALISI